MCKSFMSVAFLIVVANSVVLATEPQSGNASKGLPTTNGYLLIDEDRWYLLIEEPGNHIDRAREALLMLDARTAALEIRKAAVYFRVAAGHAVDRVRSDLIRAEHELEQTARRIETGAIKTVEQFDHETARAMHSLANYQYVHAADEWRKQEFHRAGYYWRAAAQSMERSAAATESRVRLATAEIARESRLMSKALIEGTGYAIEEVGIGFEKFGHQIERVGARVVPSPSN